MRDAERDAHAAYRPFLRAFEPMAQADRHAFVQYSLTFADGAWARLSGH